MKTSVEKAVVDVANDLASEDYSRQRLAPQPGDVYYVHLSDLLMFLEKYRSIPAETVLDYGCGGSPYRALFSTSQYLRADYVACGEVDLLIGPDGKLDLPDNSCDLVLSTQVLEHVFSPSIYLSEAFRVLKPGGKLILTTHGIWEDHGCPYDFRRWTSDGLRRELEDAGFTVVRLSKLTTGPRAILFLFSQIYTRLWDSRRGLMGWAWWLLRRSTFSKPTLRDLWVDRLFPENRMVSAEVEGHGQYLALGIEGNKY